MSYFYFFVGVKRQNYPTFFFFLPCSVGAELLQ
jgi:hypothetical protein